MPNVLQVPVGNGTASLVWNGRPAPGINSLLLQNQDLNNTVYVGNEPGITATTGNTFPILANGSVSVDPSSSWYVVGAAAGIKPLVMMPNGQANFLGITAGLGNLVIPSVQSPNFIHNVSGWQIAKDGSAEFNNLTIRGTFFGTDYIINNTGLFFYDPTEAPGNLVLSISPAGGTGPFGETIKAGIATINGTAYLQQHINTGVGAPAFELATGVGSEAEHAAIYAVAGSIGLPAEIIDLWLIGPGSSSDNVQAAIALTSNTANNTNEAAGIMNLIVSGVSQRIAYWDQFGVHMVSPNGTVWEPTLSQTDVTLGTANQTTYQNLSKIWPIGNNDIFLNTGYRLTVAGVITIGTAVPIVTVSLSVFGTNAIAIPIGGAEFVASNTYWYRAQGEVIFNPVGASAQYFGGLQVDIGSTTANQATVAGSTQTAGGFAAQSNAGSFSTLGAGSIALQAKFSAITGAPSMTGRYSVLERLSN